ncbi:hypothetical protein [Angustibacter luteus]|uniref:Roadblock/LAMTOR2 domain-containing protein n=1 Tax=Angustibacter luteus TaxID=658456 RepID=A0ABW1JG39_9ACTN
MSAYEVDAATMCDALSHVPGVEHVVLEFDERGDGVLRVQVSGDLDHASVVGAAVHQMRHRFGLGIEHQRLKLTGPTGRPVVAVVETMAAPSAVLTQTEERPAFEPSFDEPSPLERAALAAAASRDALVVDEVVDEADDDADDEADDEGADDAAGQVHEVSRTEDTVPGIAMADVRAELEGATEQLPDFWPELGDDSELRSAVDDVFGGVVPESFRRRAARHRALPKQAEPADAGTQPEPDVEAEVEAEARFPEPAQPTAVESDPTLTASDLAEPDLTEPDLTEPDLTEPDLTERAPVVRAARRATDSPRVVVERMVVTSEHNKVSASVHLRAGDVVHEGTATRPATGSGAHRALAAATAAAVEQVVTSPARLEVDQVDMLQVGPDHVAVVVLSLLGPAGIDRLTGSALVRGDAQDAVVRATLDALNRRAGLGGDRGHA